MGEWGEAACPRVAKGYAALLKSLLQQDLSSGSHVGAKAFGVSAASRFAGDTPASTEADQRLFKESHYFHKMSAPALLC